jgi:hypothetical protein
MSLTKETTIDKIEIIENGIVQVRQVIRILEDGNQLSQTYHRWCLTPGQNIEDQPANVQAICNAAWTNEVKSAYAAFEASQRVIV